MVDAQVLEAVNFFSAIVRKNGVHIHDLILFGSSSSGSATPKSDIDIAIISDDFTSKDIFERAVMTKDAEIQTVRKFKVALDVLTLTPEEYRDPASLIARHNPERNHRTDYFIRLRSSGTCVQPGSLIRRVRAGRTRGPGYVPDPSSGSGTSGSPRWRDLRCTQQRPFQPPITPFRGLTDNISAKSGNPISGIGYFISRLAVWHSLRARK